MQKFTQKVRWGLRYLLDLDLRNNVERLIAHRNRLGGPRDQRLRADQVAELRAAVAWIKQEAARDRSEEGPEAEEARGAAGGPAPAGPAPEPDGDIEGQTTIAEILAPARQGLSAMRRGMAAAGVTVADGYLKAVRP